MYIDRYITSIGLVEEFGHVVLLFKLTTSCADSEGTQGFQVFRE